VQVKSNRAAAETLELKPVLGRLAQLARSKPGRQGLEQLQPYRNRDMLQEELIRVTEMKDLLDFDDPFPFGDFVDLQSWMNQAETAGAFLSGPVFIHFLRFLIMIRQVQSYFLTRPEKYPGLRKVSNNLTPLPWLEKAISKIVGEDGSIHDNASDNLRKIRREMMRLEAAITNRLQTILKKMTDSGFAPEDTLTIRQGRPVIPVMESRRSKLSGVVVDQSATGSTLYVEPFEVVEMRNSLALQVQQEAREIERLLRQLTDVLRPEIEQIEINFHTAVRLDELLAKALFATELQALPALISQTAALDIKKGRHPLLLMKMNRDQVVPLSVKLGDGINTLVITGPNAGGKTVALKTTGLLAMMHAYGLHLPAESGTSIPLFKSIFADIGDQQSIQQDLSTFSSHITQLKEILDNSEEMSLILMDEIGSATDPDEGAALAEVILKKLTATGCLTMATTHIGALKVFAHEEAGVENGSMVFDQKTLRPTYSFQMGIPGSSYAFEIAERLGIEKILVDEARNLLGEDRGHVERLISHLEDELSRAEELRQEFELKESEVSGLINLYKERTNRLKKQGAEEKEKMLAEAARVLEDANATAERVVRDIKEKQAGKQVIRKAKIEIQRQQKNVSKLQKQKTVESEDALQPGDAVRWQGQGGRGEVLTGPDKSGRVQVQWDDFKIKIPAVDLRKIHVQKEPQKKKSSRKSGYSIGTGVKDEIDLRGKTGLEAVEAVEKYLGEARMTGFGSVRIIHGKGTGVLRREVGKLLCDHHLVVNHRPGNWNEGDTGVTVVELKE